MGEYVIGIDFGTLSARAVLVSLDSGKTLSEASYTYPHGVITDALPSGKRLSYGTALQDVRDYIEALSHTVREVISLAKIQREAVVGIGIDFTSSTVVPLDENFTPLSMIEELRDEPHAYVKLWKHHGAAREADRINALAAERGERWHARYGNRISSELAIPKILEILNEAPEIYGRAAHFAEAGDYICYLLTGEWATSAAFAGYKWLWSREEGYPDNEFFTALDPRLSGIVGTKITNRVLMPGETVGRVSESGAALTGLKVGTAVAAPMIDAHSPTAALNLVSEGDMMIVLGTSACHIASFLERRDVEGIAGYVEGGVVPNLVTYEAGQTAVGDIFDWAVSRITPAEYYREAERLGVDIHTYLSSLAERQSVGEHGLLALDWWNGNRSVLDDADLSGLILGVTLDTRAEDIYRALIEATAFGARVIIDRFGEYGLKVKSLTATGGIAAKNPFLMQIYSDVLCREIALAGTSQGAAFGGAVYAAVASGRYPSLEKAAERLAPPVERVYSPRPDAVRRYGFLYEKYKELYEMFGKSAELMHALTQLKKEVKK